LRGGGFACALPSGSPTGAAAAAHGCPPPAAAGPRRKVLDAARYELVLAVMRRVRCAGRRETVTVTGPERRALSGSAPLRTRAPEDPF